ncbi:pitrilysin family protein [Nonomuraea sp. B10E15]|uniref:M16 family metallopeptidase n=1 Tax=Nonomuraea sp. B10E15 TaxID=3153560 RepID=UPI00325D0599
MTTDEIVHPRSRTVELDNGLTVTAVHRDRFPLALLHLSIPVWGSDLAAGSIASAAMFDDDLFERTRFHLSGACATDALTIEGVGLPDDLDIGLTAMSETLADPRCDEEAVRRAGQELARGLQLGNGVPGRVAWQELLAQMYGDHPLAVLSPEVDAVCKVTGEDVRFFQRDHVLAGGAVLVVSSPRPLDEMLEVADLAFSGLPRKQVRPPGAAEPPARGTTRAVHSAGAAQTALIVGLPSVSRGDPRFPAAALANLVIGGYFSSRLTHRLRQEKGYAYWVKSTLTAAPLGPALAIATNVRPSVAGAALDIIRDDLAQLARTGPSPDELDHAKRHLLGGMRLETAGQAGFTELVFQLARNGLPPEWPRRHFAEVSKVTPADVRDFAREFLRPDAATAVLVGDKHDLKA